jgi:heme exporter protein D
MNWNDFFYMGGYAFYVWGSYGVTAVLLLAEVLLVLARRRRVMRPQDEHDGGVRETAA